MQIHQKQIGYILMALVILLLVLFIFVKLSVDEEEAFLCAIVEDSPDLTMEECPAHDSNTSWLLVVAFSISVVLLGIGTYLSFPRHSAPKEKHSESKMELDVSRLSEEEKKIYDLLRLHDGSMYQSDIMKELQVSKVQMTRILDRMEGRKIVERHRRGMTNIIILK